MCVVVVVVDCVGGAGTLNKAVFLSIPTQRTHARYHSYIHIQTQFAKNKLVAVIIAPWYICVCVCVFIQGIRTPVAAAIPLNVSVTPPPRPPLPPQGKERGME